MNLGLIIPELSVLAGAIIVILFNLFSKDKKGLNLISLAGLVVAGGFTISYWGKSNQVIFNNMLAVDHFALFFKLLFLSIAGLVILASIKYASKFAQFRGEYSALVLISTLGMMLMASATELIFLFVALELTSLTLYALVGFLKNQKSTESALKYFLLGAISSAIFLYGMIFIYGFTGTTQLGEIAVAIQNNITAGSTGGFGLLLGIVLIITGLGFKITAFPFLMWAPDVYEGAPTPVTAYLSVASKSAGFAIVLRIFYSAFSQPVWLGNEWGMAFGILAVIGMTAGNIWAIPQPNIKRMLAYSSVAQAGYIMLGLATMGFAAQTDILGQSGVLFFLAAYTATNLGAFFAVIGLSEKTGSDNIEDYAGMGKKSPLLALALSFCLISLIGIPPTAGFIAKFYLFSAAVQHNLLWLVIVAVINSVISAYYYLRVVKVMWLNEAKLEATAPASTALGVAIAISCLLVLLLGVAPNFLLRFAEIAANLFTP
ncbi:MAG: NADH-quinone oxidoreductase subunit N [Dehalococcoidales bacterium]|nr:NADH-quinone oxidoreductase subunit N [Dehalococcoidales bacterium]